jgi:outer membrane protein assembly factor BamE (lipoprotein component of BamABCDE complex)
MRHRKLAIVLALAALAVVALATLALWRRANPITQANYARISLGMSRPDVCAILGQPYDYTYGQACCVGVLPEGTPREAVTVEHWITDGCDIWMYFDREGKVSAKSCAHCMAARVSLLDKLRWRYWELTGQLH